MEQILQTVVGSEMFSLLDGFLGYNQVLFKEADQHKIMFTTKWGTFAYAKMLFGLSNTDANFQCAMNIAFKGLISVIIMFYLDDPNVFSKKREDHFRRKFLKDVKNLGCP